MSFLSATGFCSKVAIGAAAAFAAIWSPAAVGAPGAAAERGSSPAVRPSCDRQCLISLADAYFASALTREPQSLPLDRSVRMTENTFAMPVGEGLLWRAMSAPLGKYRIDVVDPASGQIAVATITTIAGQRYLTSLRLKVRKGKIVEIEQLLANNIQPLAEPNLIEPRAALLTSVPLAQRNTRSEMIRIADSYFDALTSEDSSRTAFAADCVRHEMGLRMTGNKQPLDVILPANTPVEAQRRMRILLNGVMVRSCREQIDSGAFADLHKVEPRRPIVVDEEKGLVATFPMFIQNGDVRPSPLRGYPGLEKLVEPLPFTTQWIEIFKIHSGGIHEIEAPVMLPLYYGAGNGWGARSAF